MFDDVYTLMTPGFKSGGMVIVGLTVGGPSWRTPGETRGFSTALPANAAPLPVPAGAPIDVGTILQTEGGDVIRHGGDGRTVLLEVFAVIVNEVNKQVHKTR